ncbi:MAG: DUF2283 domain-containing protein [Chloroflexi bacterium]|nr:DUF2283 domain-containing protein [Chloroflexota bacterium]
MKFSYYPETDSLYIELVERPGADAREVADNMVVDLDEAGQVVGIDIQHASELVDLARLDVLALPVKTVQMAA